MEGGRLMTSDNGHSRQPAAAGTAAPSRLVSEHSKVRFPEVHAICAEFDIEIISSTWYPGPRQTRATVTLDRIRRHHGDGHLRLVLSTLIEAASEEVMLDEFTLTATSALVRECSDWIEQDLSSWYSAWEALPLGQIYWCLCRRASMGKTSSLLAGALYVMLMAFNNRQQLPELTKRALDRRVFATMARPGTQQGWKSTAAISLGRTLLAAGDVLGLDQMEEWVEKECKISMADARQYVRLALEDEGLVDDPAPRRQKQPRTRPPRRHERLSEADKVSLGQMLLAKKQELPRGHFMPWLQKESGFSQQQAYACMQAAKAAAG